MCIEQKSPITFSRGCCSALIWWLVSKFQVIFLWISASRYQKRKDRWHWQKGLCWFTKTWTIEIQYLWTKGASAIKSSDGYFIKFASKYTQYWLVPIGLFSWVHNVKVLISLGKLANCYSPHKCTGVKSPYPGASFQQNHWCSWCVAWE